MAADQEGVAAADVQMGEARTLDGEAKQQEVVVDPTKEPELPEEPELPKEPDLPKEPEPAKELEQDAVETDLPSLKDPVCFLTNDLTVNVMASVHGNILMALTDGGLQYLLAGARANVGITSGRYMFEAKVVELLNPGEVGSQRARTPQPRQILRIGFSTAESTLFLSETENNICFDSEGTFSHNRTSHAVSQKFARDQIISVVLNLEKDSPNANTLSVFRDGVRASLPQPLPECLKGKPLFPTVTFRNLSVHLNFGPNPLSPMPFKCLMVQSAKQKDVTVVAKVPPKDVKYEAIFPILLPDQGSFDWLDQYLEKHPDCVELSDRSILDWAAKSGIWRPKGYSWKASNDRPEMGFGIPQMDDCSIRRVLNMVAPIQRRSFVVMEVKGNLIKEEREEALKRFNAPHFKRVALVMIGEPSGEFKSRVQSLIRKEKQDQSDIVWKTKKAEEARRRTIERTHKKLLKQQQKAEREKVQAAEAAEAAAKKAEEEKKVDVKRPEEGEKKEEGSSKQDDPKEEKSRDAAESGESSQKQEGEGKKEDGETPPIAKKEGEESDNKCVNGVDDDEATDDEKMVDADDEQPPAVELTEEEKQLWFRKTATTDLVPATQNASFTNFSLPDGDEAFDEVRFEWHEQRDGEQFLRQWVLNQKLATRIDDLEPSVWFHERWIDWQRQLHTWHLKQNEFKDPVKKPVEKDSGPKVTEEAEQKEGGTSNENKGTKENKADLETNGAEDTDDFDVFGVDDVGDIGKGEPLFANFTFEDWALMSLRFELHLLAHAFIRDANDPERIGIHVDHLSFYYQKYYKKAFNAEYYGVDSVSDLVDLIADTVWIAPRNVLESQLPTDLDTLNIFVKLTEESRRERQRLIDTGDETVILKFAKPAAPPPAAPPATGAAIGSVGSVAVALPPRPYQRGSRTPMPGKGAGGGYSGPQSTRYWGGAPQGQRAGPYYGGAGAAAGGYRPTFSGGKGYSPQTYGPQKRPYSYGKAGYGRG